MAKRSNVVTHLRCSPWVGYREFKSISPLLLPSERTYQRAKKENKSRDGAQCVQVYLSNQLSRCGENVHGYLIFDEMKLKGGVIFNLLTGEAVGMADDMLDLKSVLKRLFSDDGQEFKGAEKVNQWMYMTLVPIEGASLVAISSTMASCPEIPCSASLTML